MRNAIKVSIFCLAYNHEKYISKTLEGFVNQKTNFMYEVFVHDDASTDGTADIIKSYAEKYPNIIKPIYQIENQHSQKISIVKTFILPLMKGKYVAICEGDDYWTDENKLQLQYDAMEEHPECVMCSHYVELFDIEKCKVLRTFPNVKHYKLKTGVIDGRLQYELVFGFLHLSADFFKRDIFEDYQLNRPQFAQTMVTGDKAIVLYFMNKGPFYFITRKMSQYNKGTEGSYTIRIERDKKKNKEKDIANLKALREFEIYADEKWKDMIKHEIRLKEVQLRVDNIGYRAYFMKENVDVLHGLPFKTKLKYFIGVFCPKILQLYNRLHG